MINTEFLTVECQVTTPKTRIGLLPYRDKETGKLIFPYGTWRGVFNSVELREAIKWGANIDKILGHFGTLKQKIILENTHK